MRAITVLLLICLLLSFIATAITDNYNYEHYIGYDVPFSVRVFSPLKFIYRAGQGAYQVLDGSIEDYRDSVYNLATSYSDATFFQGLALIGQRFVDLVGIVISPVKYVGLLISDVYSATVEVGAQGGTNVFGKAGSSRYYNNITLPDVFSRYEPSWTIDDLGNPGPHGTGRGDIIGN